MPPRASSRGTTRQSSHPIEQQRRQARANPDDVRGLWSGNAESHERRGENEGAGGVLSK